MTVALPLLSPGHLGEPGMEDASGPRCRVGPSPAAVRTQLDSSARACRTLRAVPAVQSTGARSCRMQPVQGGGPRSSRSPSRCWSARARPRRRPVPAAGTISAADGTIASYDWQWGDATADDHGAKPSHAFAKPGTYQVALFVLDDNTQSGAAIHNVTVVPLVAPAFSHATVTNASFRVGSGPTAIVAKAPKGTSFRFTLKAPAKVTIAIARRGKGRRVKAGKLTRAHLHNGPNAIAFSGRIGKRALKRGKYAATLTASNAKGKAKPVAVRFTIVK
jgi:hypothetical protein